MSSIVVCDTAKVRFFKQITTALLSALRWHSLFAILQKYDFSSKSQLLPLSDKMVSRCLRYCKSTIFQANHNCSKMRIHLLRVVCDTAKVRFFKQITTKLRVHECAVMLFAILQKYDFSSKSQPTANQYNLPQCCLRYCKSTIFQANHNKTYLRFARTRLFAILQKYDFSSKSQLYLFNITIYNSCLRYCKSTIFQANHN